MMWTGWKAAVMAGTVALFIGSAALGGSEPAAPSGQVATDADKASNKEHLVVLTGRSGGVYAALGDAVSRIVTREIPGLTVSEEATQGSIDNLNRLQHEQGDLAFALSDSLIQAWQGDRDAGFPENFYRIRVVATLHPNYLQLVATQASGIRSISDLRGKRVAIGMPNSGVERNALDVLNAAGIYDESFAQTVHLPFADALDEMRKGKLDAVFQSTGLGVAPIEQLAHDVPVTLVPLTPDVVAKLGAPYQPSIIPAGTYPGQTTAVATAAIPNMLVARAGLSDDMVYALVGALQKELPELAAAHPAAHGVTLEAALQAVPVPLHPGAERFYREHGLED
ncbi:TAXI family TRAP transporter solute-binding subunit [Ancylobacter sp. 6x-1]|uniref:TAXI family TRAP transporter solute-binding subunit n=1 Tax=Ancylobacter crimeensis TaxID=2579147 RepID=A0ABT0DG71_9HYPH|nr:TAXI family TRAP transporter solute-binding subunit [Ancylobacter crimeensis]MCK0198961.1 TAXI family TRAP transporter solute-binding subunit [Ancylobacter crimeensis]